MLVKFFIVENMYFKDPSTFTPDPLSVEGALFNILMDLTLFL